MAAAVAALSWLAAALVACMYPATVAAA